MPPELREKIETALVAVGEVEYQRMRHRRKCPLVARVLPDADLVHERAEIVRKCGANRLHYCRPPLSA